MQEDNPHSFHARIYRQWVSSLSTSSRFHPREDEDVDTSFPWHVHLEDDASIELANEVSHREYISQKRKDQANMDVMCRWGFRRRAFYEEAVSRRSSPRHRGMEIPPPASYH